MTQTPQEIEGRQRKVSALVDELTRVGATVEYVRAMGPVEWAVCSHAAGVKHPSDETKRLVVFQFEERQKYETGEKHPLDGLPQ